MLVNNDCLHDSRVIREAEALASFGHVVTVVCRLGRRDTRCESRSNVTYMAVSSILERLRIRFSPNVGSVGGQTSGLADRTMPATQDHGNHAGSRFATRVYRSFWEFLRGHYRSLFPFIMSDEFRMAARRAVIGLDPDIIHAHDLVTLPCAVSCAQTTGAKIIYDSHELELHRNASYANIVEWRRRRQESRLIREVDCVITVSDSIADHLAREYAIERPLVVLNAPDPLPASSRGEIRSELGLDRGVGLVVYVGSLTIGRGVEKLVEALPLLPDLHAAVIGPVNPDTLSAVVRLSEALGVADRFHVVRPVPPREVVPFISSADASVVPIQATCLSYAYALPNKLLESVHAGLPVVASDLTEMRRFIDCIGCGVVMDETDPDAIATAIREVLTNRERYRSTLEERRALLSSYSWSEQARRLADLYQRLAGDSGGEDRVHRRIAELPSTR